MRKSVRSCPFLQQSRARRRARSRQACPATVSLVISLAVPSASASTVVTYLSQHPHSARTGNKCTSRQPWSSTAILPSLSMSNEVQTVIFIARFARIPTRSRALCAFTPITALVLAILAMSWLLQICKSFSCRLPPSFYLFFN